MIHVLLLTFGLAPALSELAFDARVEGPALSELLFDARVEGPALSELAPRQASGARVERVELSALNFLLGDWDAIELPRGESGAFNFSLAIQDRLIVRTNYAKYPARDGKPATRHDDLMVIFVEGDALKADYFDSEQHVIHYLVQPRGPTDVVFVSERKAGEPRYRLSYMLAANGHLKGTFETASSEAPDDFKPLLAWTARKLK